MRENLKLVFHTLWTQVSSLFFLLLVISGGVSIFLGEKTDGIIIFTIIFVNTLLGFIQEFRASRASRKLLDLVETKVYVLREGSLVLIRSSDLVLSDVVHLVPGAIVPADLEVIESNEGYIDDSIRTGETMSKEVHMGEKLFSGSVVLSGKITGYITALGEKSSVFKYRGQLERVQKWSSFGVFTNRVIKYVFAISILSLLLAMLLLVFILHKYTLAHFFIFAIAMLVGVVPEILPLIITIILTRESLLLAKDKVIVKRLSSLQSLGAVKFLLTDKTGTITENKLKVAAVHDVKNFWDASNAVSEGDYERPPMDKAYDEALNSSIAKIKTVERKITNFDPFKNNVGYEVFTLDGGDKVARGIIGKILALCDSKTFTGKETILKSAQAYEVKGMRVIAIAKGIAGVWQFAGFVAFHDPIKASSLPSLKIAHERGIGVKILTGDSEAVAMSVAEELQLIKHPDAVISLDKRKVSSLGHSELLRAVVFAKCTPENKLELIDQYLKLGPVAFLGDGINDALALKRADIGIAVDNASDIAKESSDAILLEKDLSPILKSVSTGRRALRNIITYIMYTLSGNAGTFISILLASFFYPVLPMMPIQILLNNLLTDLPLLLLITDNIDDYTLQHVPHFEPGKLMKRVLIFGVISSFFDFVYFQLFKDVSVSSFQTGWFLLSVLAELALVMSIRSSRSILKSPPVSMPLAIGIVVTSVLPFIFIFNPTLAHMFKFSALSFSTLGVLFSITIVYVFINEIAKFFMRKKNLYNKPIVLANIFK